MKPSSALLARLLLATSVVACSSSSSGGGGTAAGAAGGSGTTADATGGGGATAAGAGGTSACGKGEISYELVRCFAPDGTFTPVISTMAGPANGPCSAMVRAADAPCPAADQVCVSPFCSVHAEATVGPATPVAGQCCYPIHQCLGASGCGRPIVVERMARVARAVSRGDWG